MVFVRTEYEEIKDSTDPAAQKDISKKEILRLLDAAISERICQAETDATIDIEEAKSDIAIPSDPQWERYFNLAGKLDREYDQLWERVRRHYKPKKPQEAEQSEPGKRHSREGD